MKTIQRVQEQHQEEETQEQRTGGIARSEPQRTIAGASGTAPGKQNKTGLPDKLKSGIENLSGYAMDDVKVHYNSGKPSQLQAHAYTQGTDIHIAPGQEKHLPHEAWHAVQQMQGRVQPTMQMKGKVDINDDSGLEKEADVMGQRAIDSKFRKADENKLIYKNTSHDKTVQRVSRTESWNSQERKYQANRVDKARIQGDALWGAMVRFSRDVPDDFKQTHTVREVLAEAEKTKILSFDDWKGEGRAGTSQEAQHLVSASYATKELKWPYSQINSEDNFKMLLAGRGGKGDKTSDAYTRAKKERHPLARFIPFVRAGKSARGYKHISSGIAHPKYEKVMKQLIEAYYNEHGLTKGNRISDKHASAIKKILRQWHKKGDGKSDKSIDEMAVISPPKLPSMLDKVMQWLPFS